MKIIDFIAYVKQAWKNKPDTSTPLSADRLTHMEDGIKGNSDAIEKIAAAVVSQIVNDPDKIASMAALYGVNQTVAQLNSDLAFKSIGNATSSPGWDIIASNVHMENGIGVLYGTIKHNVATVPAWGDLIGKFPDFTPKYWIPLTLFDLRGEIIMSVAVNKTGEIRVYRPDIAKFNVVNEYDFYTAYFG